jgi:predicted DNA-binding protein YlxM (UPF0122 family)
MIQITKSLLEELYISRGMTQAEIADYCNCDQGTICSRMKAYGIPARSQADYAQLALPCDELGRLYVDEGLTQAEIATRLNCHESTVIRRMKECGLPVRSRRVDLSCDELRRLYFDERLTLADIAVQFNCDTSTIGNRMKECGLFARTPGDYRRIILPRHELYDLYVVQNLGADVVANHFGCSRKAVTANLRRYDIPVRSPGGPVGQGHVPKDVYATWTSDLAYALGLIASDGNLVKKRHEVVLVSTDLEIMDYFAGCLQLSPEVQPHLQKRPNNCKPTYVLSFSDMDFYAFLMGIGITPSKSKTLEPLNVPEVLFPDLLRGLMDGDGSWVTHRSKPPHEYLVAQLTSASPVFLAWVQATVERLIGLHGGTSGIQLTYYGRKAVQLGAWLYYASDIPALSRKRTIWEKFAKF